MSITIRVVALAIMLLHGAEAEAEAVPRRSLSRVLFSSSVISSSSSSSSSSSELMSVPNPSSTCDMSDIHRCGLKHSGLVLMTEDDACKSTQGIWLLPAQCAVNVGCKQEYLALLDEFYVKDCEANGCAACNEPQLEELEELTPAAEPGFDKWADCEVDAMVLCMVRDRDDGWPGPDCPFLNNAVGRLITCSRENGCPLDEINDLMAEPLCDKHASELSIGCGFDVNCSALLELYDGGAGDNGEYSDGAGDNDEYSDGKGSDDDEYNSDYYYSRPVVRNDTETCGWRHLDLCQLRHVGMVGPDGTSCDAFLTDLIDVMQCTVNLGCSAEEIAQLLGNRGAWMCTAPLQPECDACDEILDMLPLLEPEDDPELDEWAACDITAFNACLLDDHADYSDECTWFVPSILLPFTCAQRSACPAEQVHNKVGVPLCELYAPNMPADCAPLNCAALLELYDGDGAGDGAGDNDEYSDGEGNNGEYSDDDGYSSEYYYSRQVVRNDTEACGWRHLDLCYLRHVGMQGPGDISCDAFLTDLVDAMQCTVSFGCSAEKIAQLLGNRGALMCRAAECNVCDELIDMLPLLEPEDDPELDEWAACDMAAFYACLANEYVDFSDECSWLVPFSLLPFTCAQKSACPADQVHDKVGVPWCEYYTLKVSADCEPLDCTALPGAAN